MDRQRDGQIGHLEPDGALDVEGPQVADHLRFTRRAVEHQRTAGVAAPYAARRLPQVERLGRHRGKPAGVIAMGREAVDIDDRRRALFLGQRRPGHHQRERREQDPGPPRAPAIADVT